VTLHEDCSWLQTKRIPELAESSNSEVDSKSRIASASALQRWDTDGGHLVR
jgi:hypothetical protein